MIKEFTKSVNSMIKTGVDASTGTTRNTMRAPTKILNACKKRKR